MLRKNFIVKKPVDEVAVPLEMFLNDISKKALQSASGEYTGDGTSSKEIITPFSPRLVLIAPKVNLTTSAATLAGTFVVALYLNPGATWVPATGFIKTGVTAFSSNSFTVGASSYTNAAGTTFMYYVIG